MGESYVDYRMREWRMLEQPRRIRSAVRKVLKELSAEALLTLKDSRLEVMVLPDAGFSVWAYFPVHKRRFVVTSNKLELKPETRVLLLLSAARHAEEPVTFEGDLSHHLGHVLLYLRSPKASNECANADKEWAGGLKRKGAKRGTKKEEPPAGGRR